LKQSFRKKIDYCILLYMLSVIGTLLATHIMLELGCHYGRITYIFTLYFMDIKYAAYNLLIYGALLSVLVLITGRIWLGELIISVLAAIISIINYYVIQWHGTPLTLQEAKNVKTALNVIKSYRIVVYKHVWYILVVLFINVLIVILCKHYFGVQLKQRKIRKTLLISSVVELAVLSVWGYYLVPEDPVTWDWRGGYQQYGYAFTTISRAIRFSDPVVKPEGYDDFDYGTISNLHKHNTEDIMYPDIIMILNETLYDPSVIINMETDAPYNKYFYGFDKWGERMHAVVPQAGGGTNKTEYELLTSNSMELLPDVTPFNVLKMSNADSIVSFLKQFGYYTIAMHPGEPTSYNRKYAFECLGFDEVYFGNDFLELEKYKDRVWPTDESVYRNMLQVYTKTKESNQPIFLYMLTYQNHGGFDTSDSNNDIIHVRGEYGGYNEQLNEYLTSISLSDTAFRDLKDYFFDSEHQVIISMLGDHCPDFMPDMVQDISGEVDEILIRSTPLVIWSNYGTEESVETVSVNYIAPMICEKAKIPLSEFYQYLLDLKKSAPILTSMGYYITNDGEKYKYQEGPEKDNIAVYHYMEYDRITQRHDFDVNIYR